MAGLLRPRQCEAIRVADSPCRSLSESLSSSGHPTASAASASAAAAAAAAGDRGGGGACDAGDACGGAGGREAADHAGDARLLPRLRRPPRPPRLTARSRLAVPAATPDPSRAHPARGGIPARLDATPDTPPGAIAAAVAATRERRRTGGTRAHGRCPSHRPSRWSEPVQPRHFPSHYLSHSRWWCCATSPDLRRPAGRLVRGPLAAASPAMRASRPASEAGA